MRMFPGLIGLAMLLTSCGSSGPAVVDRGPGLTASLAAEWPTSAAPRQAEFSRDGRFLATSDASGLITLRETTRWRTVARLQHEGGATSVAFSPDSRTLFSGGYDGKVRVWDLATRKPSGVLAGPTRTLWSIDVSPDGSKVAAAGEDATVYVWTLSAPNAPQALRGHERNIWEVRFSPDGKLIASGSFDRTARLWDAASGKLLRTLTGHDQAIVGLAFRPDGKVLATSGDDSTIRFWRMPDGSPQRTLAVGNHTYKLAFSGDGRWLVSGGRARGGLGTFWHQLTGGGGTSTPIRIWRTDDAALVGALPANDDIAHVGISRNGEWLVSASEDQRVRLWRLKPRG